MKAKLLKLTVVQFTLDTNLVPSENFQVILVIFFLFSPSDISHFSCKSEGADSILCLFHPYQLEHHQFIHLRTHTYQYFCIMIPAE